MMLLKIPVKYIEGDLPEGYMMTSIVNGIEIEFKCVDGKILYMCIDPPERHLHMNKKYGYWREWEKWKGWCR